jgi:hypothetical protein
MVLAVVGFSVPVFVIGLRPDLRLRHQAALVPVQGYQPPREGLGGFLQRLILPSLTLSVIYVALIARMTRTSVLETLGEDYIRTARAKGQVELKILFRHALRNAAVPIVTVIGLGDRPADRRGGGDGERLHHPRPRPPDRGRGARPRLPDHPGRDSAVLLRLRADQSPDRPDVPRLDPRIRY